MVAIIFFVAFILSVKSGQYDDSYTPSVRMLFEDELVKPSAEKRENASLRDTKQAAESELKKSDYRAALVMTIKNKIQLNKQE